MKDKVAEAIKKRGDNIVHDAAAKLRDAARNFAMSCCGARGYQTGELANALRGLADELDGKTQIWIIPHYFWEKAREKAFDEFMTQFDALTRFVNKNIEFKDGNCTEPAEEAR